MPLKMKSLSLIAIGIALLSANVLAQELFGVGERASTTSPTTQSTTRPAPRRAAARNPKNIVDKLVHVDSPDGWSDGTLRNVTIEPDAPARITLGYRERGFPRTGTWMSDEERAEFPFTRLIASFNVSTPAETGVMLEMRVKHGEDWSPWVYMQSWGKVVQPIDRELKWDGGKLETDELVLSKPAEQYQARLTLTSFGFEQKITPSVRRLSVCYSGVVDDEEKRKRVKPPTTAPSNWARNLKVPFRGQGALDNPRQIRGMICSPTSVSMVLHYHGIDRPTIENCMAIYDPHFDLFGNWGRAVSRAGEFGLDAWLTRFRNWDDVKSEISNGNPVIASIYFARGEVKGFIYENTGGHLLVIRGFTPSGDVIVNDPASRDKGNGAIYPAEEFARAWFDNGGVAYVIHKPATAPIAQKPSTMPTTAPISTIR
jgi:hypothetical protein